MFGRFIYSLLYSSGLLNCHASAPLCVTIVFISWRLVIPSGVEGGKATFF
jgi:hypothetical protein